MNRCKICSATLLAAALLVLCVTGCSRVLTEEMLLHPAPPRDAFSMDRTLTVDMNIGTTRARAVAQPAEVRAADGVKLRGWYFYHPNNRRYLMFLHGSLGVMERSERFLAWLSLYLDANVLAIDYRGYGYSEGTRSLASMADDALAVYDALAARTDHPDDPIFVYGYSLGTAVACHLAAQRDTAGVILMSSFTCAEDVCATAGPLWLRALTRMTADDRLTGPRQPIDNIRDIREPILLIHGDSDLVTTIGLGREMFAAAGAPDKSMVEVVGRGHEDLQVSASPVREKLLEFIERATAERAAQPYRDAAAAKLSAAADSPEQ